MPYCEALAHEHGLVFFRVFLGGQLVGLGLVLQAGLKHLLHIGNQAALARLGELEANEGVEPQSASAEKLVAVDEAIVEVVDDTLVDDLYASLYIKRNKKVASQSVAGAAWYYGQGRVGVGEALRHFVDGAVAANGHHDIDAFFSGLPRKLGSVTGVLSFHDVIAELRLV